eukprot:CAMPEP_0116906102 /NCGR_PEP_ID=MMETSP0467-20121206/12338_1 /TAXON_ID=283647 /ORGANISM="Mesodinium pulex, Strain SPMC105" /LENGTH=58 /DNA_ID=CAMNT_0004580921 /DNA_START=275 /DNA_END=451 /DNA_ORIENTATION=+
MNVDNLTQGLIGDGKKIRGFYENAKKYAMAAEDKTNKAKQLAEKLKSAVEAAEDARTA